MGIRKFTYDGQGFYSSNELGTGLALYTQLYPYSHNMFLLLIMQVMDPNMDI